MLVLMIAWQKSKATCSKWYSIFFSGIMRFFEFLVLFNRGILRSLTNMSNGDSRKKLHLRCFSGFSIRLCSISNIAVESVLPHTEFFLKIILNIFVSLNESFFDFFRKDNFTFKCHRSDVSGSGQTQDVYAVKFLLTLHTKWSFPLRIFSCGFGHIYWINPRWKTSFCVQCQFYVTNLLVSKN